jgi:hypothetical protein
MFASSQRLVGQSIQAANSGRSLNLHGKDLISVQEDAVVAVVRESFASSPAVAVQWAGHTYTPERLRATIQEYMERLIIMEKETKIAENTGHARPTNLRAAPVKKQCNLFNRIWVNEVYTQFNVHHFDCIARFLKANGDQVGLQKLGVGVYGPKEYSYMVNKLQHESGQSNVDLLGIEQPQCTTCLIATDYKNCDYRTLTTECVDVPATCFDVMVTACETYARFDALMEEFSNETGSLRISEDYTRALHCVKSLSRMCVKSFHRYSSRFGRNHDIIRGSLIYDSPEEILMALKAIYAASGEKKLEILRVRNRFAAAYDAASKTGFRYISINVRLPKHDHVCEIIVHLSAFFDRVTRDSLADYQEWHDKEAECEM